MILPKNAPQIKQIRQLISQVVGKMNMSKERNTYHLPAWVDDEGTPGFNAREP